MTSISNVKVCVYFLFVYIILFYYLPVEQEAGCLGQSEVCCSSIQAGNIMYILNVSKYNSFIFKHLS